MIHAQTLTSTEMKAWFEAAQKQGQQVRVLHAGQRVDVGIVGLVEKDAVRIDLQAGAHVTICFNDMTGFNVLAAD